MSSESKEAELQRLRGVENRLRSITEHAPDFMLQFDRTGRITYMNRPAPGHTLDDMIGTDVRKWMEPQFHEAFNRTIDTVFETGEVSSYESVGTVTGRYYVNRVSPVNAGDTVVSAVLITHDITDMKRAEIELRDADTRYRALVEASFEGLAVSVARTLIHCNQVLADMFGYSLDEMRGKSPATMATPESQALIARNVRAQVETPYEVTCVRKDGSTFPCELLGRNTTYQGEAARITGFRDLTERRRLEAEQERREDRVRHAQKLETLGVLAGGIAHDFNNLLAVTLSNAGSALAHLNERDRVQHCLEQIKTATLRARDLTQQLLVYAGRAEHEREQVDISAMVTELTELLRVSISKTTEIRYSLESNLPPVDVDVAQVHQIIVNLIVNASEAMQDHAGRIDIATGVMDADSSFLTDSFGDRDLPPGEYVYLEVVDNGCGMDGETLLRIFDPFFTSKFAGRGLGLAVVQGIMRAHDGTIAVHSEPGTGTRFRVLFPISRADAVLSPPPKEEANQSPLPQNIRGQLVLLAEDEELLASAVEGLLEDAGYRVVVADNGNTAVEIFTARADEISIALLDMTMPKRDGLEVLTAIHELSPQLPVILLSGHTDQTFRHLLVREPRVSFMAKPFDIDALLELMENALAGT